MSSLYPFDAVVRAVLAVMEAAPVQARDLVLFSLICVLLVWLWFIRRRLSKLEDRMGVSTGAPAQWRDGGNPQGSYSGDALDPAILAVISTAVYIVIEGHARIASVTATDIKPVAWSVEGRRQIFESHNVR